MVYQCKDLDASGISRRFTGIAICSNPFWFPASKVQWPGGDVEQYPLPDVPQWWRQGGPHLQDVVARVVTVVTDADLCAHVPAAEGTGAELQATDLQQHVGDRREAIPLEPQVLEPVKPADSKMVQLMTDRTGVS